MLDMRYTLCIHKDITGRVTMDLVDEDGAILISGVELPRHGAGALTANSSTSAMVIMGERTLRRVVAPTDALPWEKEANELMGLTVIRTMNGTHVQLREDGKAFADWWPSKGTTMKDGKRGPVCATGEDLIAWLRSV
jgi:hypothetical protein